VICCAEEFFCILYLLFISSIILLKHNNLLLLSIYIIPCYFYLSPTTSLFFFYTLSSLLSYLLFYSTKFNHSPSFTIFQPVSLSSFQSVCIREYSCVDSSYPALPSPFSTSLPSTTSTFLQKSTARHNPLNPVVSQAPPPGIPALFRWNTGWRPAGRPRPSAIKRYSHLRGPRQRASGSPCHRCSA